KIASVAGTLLKERDTSLRVKHERPRGVLNVKPAGAVYGHTRYWPSEELAPFVEHYWIVRWDLAEPGVAETVPHPSIHVVFDTDGTPEVVGLMTKRFTRRLEGRGGAIGTKFRPGAFRPFLKSSVSALTDRRFPLTEILGRSANGLRERVLGEA